MPASTPRELHILFEQAFNDRDINAIVALYEPDAVFISSGRPVLGHERIRKAYLTFLPAAGRMKLATRKVILSADGLALLHSSWSIGPPSETRGLSTEVARRQPDGTWLFAIDNPNLPQ